MSYICNDCGNIFEDGEQAYWGESRGEYGGAPCSEEMSGCPLCHGDYEEASTCEICGGAFLEKNLVGGVCQSCIDTYRKDFDICYKIANYERKSVEINALLADTFEPSDIEAILINYIKTKGQDISFDEFIDSDPVWFAERLAEEVKNNENKKN